MGGCEQCGARAVGEALPKPLNQLPSYGRALILSLSGSIVVLVFLVQTILAMFQRKAGIGFWSWIAAGETAAWRLKWISIPVFILALWFGRKVYGSIVARPDLFCGQKHARRGLSATFVVVLLVVGLIGITVPARIRQRKTSLEAAMQARYYAFDLAMFRYQQKYKTLPDPSTLKEDLARIPDPDGTIAEALRDLDPLGYQPRADVAANATPKRPSQRGDIMRKVSLTMATDDATPGGLSYTDYELRLPGEDKILFTDDDWVGHDGVIKPLSEVAKGGVGRSVSNGVLKP
ncbi:MAG: hypothetical protein C5B55_10840 [Blastocatellia bacterium]|nr:MAG: hypothetical protein C5B55_10840 [Blastocatellia bacterium]